VIFFINIITYKFDCHKCIQGDRGDTETQRHREKRERETYMHGGGPSPSGSNLRHSYGLAAVSSAQTSAKGRFPRTHTPISLLLISIKNLSIRIYFPLNLRRKESKMDPEELTIIPTNCHEISLPHQCHHMSVAWPWSRALNNNPIGKLAPLR
jgi:hypothetical protein